MLEKDGRPNRRDLRLLMAHLMARERVSAARQARRRRERSMATVPSNDLMGRILAVNLFG